MINLLHLSDLHFGFDRDQTSRAQRAASLDLLRKELAKLTPDWKPHVLVISGDLSWQGKPEGYTELSQWLTKKLFPDAGLTPADCIICPGNHDLDRKAARSLVDRTQDRKRAHSPHSTNSPRTSVSPRHSCMARRTISPACASSTASNS